MLVCLKFFGDATCRIKLVEILGIAKPDRKAFDRSRHLLRHQRYVSRRIYATREKHSEWNVRHHAFPNRVAQQPQDFRFVLLIAARIGTCRRQGVPLLLYVECAITSDSQPVTCRKFPYVAKESVRYRCLQSSAIVR